MMRAFAAAALGIAAGIFGFAAAAAFVGPSFAAGVFAALAAAIVGLLAYKRPIVPLEERAVSRGLAIVSALATVGALVQLARLAIFAVDPAQVGFSSLPTSDWEVRHSCLTAYFVAAEAASTTPHIYEESLYSAPDDDPSAPRKPLRLGEFNIDVYEYPPPFLLLPRVLRLAAPEFLPHRMLWFAIDCGVVLLAILLVARFLGPTLGTRALLLSPLIWVSLPTASTLQKGNVQAIIIAAAMIAMLLFERRRWAAGGALLGFVTVSKLYPGLLIVYLLARRQWSAVAWTVAAAIVFVVVSLLDMGWAPYAAFLDHLPGLVGGEAFPAFRRPAAMAINSSIPGLVFKAKLFGVPGMGFPAAKVVGWIYTLVALGLIVTAARRTLRENEKPLVWLAILILATLRSPFLPQAYAAFPPLWMLTLLAATYAPTTRALVITILACAALNIYWPIDQPMDPRVLALVNGVPQAATVVVAVRTLQRRLEPAPAAD